MAETTGGAITTAAGADTTAGGAEPTASGADTTEGGADTTEGGADTTEGGAETTEPTEESTEPTEGGRDHDRWLGSAGGGFGRLPGDGRFHRRGRGARRRAVHLGPAVRVGRAAGSRG